MAAKSGAKKKLQYWGTGRRKKAIARVRLVAGNGSVNVNRRSLDDYFGLDTLNRQRKGRRSFGTGRRDPSRYRPRARRCGRGL